MKRSLVMVFAAAALGGPLAASAHGNSYIDGYGILADSETELVGIGRADDEGDGAGAKAQLDLGGLHITGEYQSVDYDDTEIELDQARIGIAIGPGAGNGGGFYGGAEYVNFSFDYPGIADDEEEDQDGFGGHIGYAIPLAPIVRLYGQAGYVKLDDIDGPEFLAGISVALLPNLGVFADYRATDFEDEDENELSFDDVRLGVRFSF